MTKDLGYSPQTSAWLTTRLREYSQLEIAAGKAPDLYK